MGSTQEQSTVPTLEDVVSTRLSRRARSFRRVGLVALLAIVVAACMGLLGPASGNTAKEGPAGEQVEIEFPSPTRPGLDSKVRVKLTPAGRMTEEVVLTIDQEMYDVLGLHQVVPEPRHQQSDGNGRVSLTFDPPEDRTLSVTFTGRTPTQQLPGSYRFDMDVGAPGSEVVVTSFRTWVLP